MQTHRSLLDDPDPVSPVLQTLATALRLAVREAHTHYGQVHDHELAALAQHPLWSSLPERKRSDLLAKHALVALLAPPLASEADLLASPQGRTFILDALKDGPAIV